MRSFGLLTDKAQVVVVNAPQGEGVPPAVARAGAERPGDRRPARARTPADDPRGAGGLHGRVGDHRARPRPDHPGRLRRRRRPHLLHRRRARGPRLEPRTRRHRRRRRRQDPHRPRPRLHPRRGHRLRRPRAAPARSRRRRPRTSSASRARTTSSRMATSCSSAAAPELPLSIPARRPPDDPATDVPRRCLLLTTPVLAVDEPKAPEAAGVDAPGLPRRLRRRRPRRLAIHRPGAWAHRRGRRQRRARPPEAEPVRAEGPLAPEHRADRGPRR